MPEQLDVAPADAQSSQPAQATQSSAQTLPPYEAAPPASDAPGRILGIVGFALSFVAIVNVVGLVLSIVALVQSRRAGRGNGFAVAGIVIAGVGVAVTALLLGLGISALVGAAQVCAELGDGVHQIGNSTYTCTPTSFHVYTGTGA